MGELNRREIMDAFFIHFKVDSANFNFFKYWPVETFILFALCTCGSDQDTPCRKTCEWPLIQR